jgi:hypothetical protein
VKGLHEFEDCKKAVQEVGRHFTGGGNFVIAQL